MPLPPAQRLNYDVLSIIFVMSSRGSKTGALKLSSVCRLWRYIALSVPEIWSRFYLGALITPHILYIFLERSKPLPLHIIVADNSSDEQLQVLSSAADRIVCMTISNSCRFFQNKFPILERLVLQLLPDADRKGGLASREYFSKSSQFPQLQEFCYISASAPPLHRIFDLREGFSGLQKLEMTCEDDSSWPSVVQGTSDTLVSLALYLLPSCSVHDFSFPQLRHLQISALEGVQVVLDLDAPRLESVEQGEGVGEKYGIDIRLRNPRSVKELCIVYEPLDLTLYPALRKLWIYGHAGCNPDILRSLRHQIALCPELEAVFYCDMSQYGETNDGEDEYSQPGSVLLAIVNVVRETERDITVREFCSGELDLPGSMRLKNACLGSLCDLVRDCFLAELF